MPSLIAALRRGTGWLSTGMALLGACTLAGCVGDGPGAWTALALASCLGLWAACDEPGGRPVDETCSGAWEQACRDGRRTRVCCPAGVFCNYGRGVVWCEGNRCAVAPDTCDDGDVAGPDALPDSLDDADAACDGAWESACREGRIVQLCCPAGLACNYGQTMVDCGDGACVEMPATCPP